MSQTNNTMKEKREIQMSNWWKNFLTGVLATAIGVGLTFEVNNRVEHHKHKEAQRQVAMMAIYDIDMILNQFIKEKQREDAFFKVATYLSTHQDELETTSMDSLWMASAYLHLDNTATPDWFDDSTEKVFTSSMDAILHIGDVTFYDNVQECYRLRRDMKNMITNNVNFRKPITDDFVTEYRKHLSPTDIQHNGAMNNNALAGLLRLMLQQDEVILYMQKYLIRDDYYREQFIDKLALLNQENKYIMNISDEDLQLYVAKHINKTIPPTPKLLIGAWCNKQNDFVKTHVYHKDHTFSTSVQQMAQAGVNLHSENIHVSILMPISFIANGEWGLHEDTLRMDFDTASIQITSLDFDLSSLPASIIEEEKDSLDIHKKGFEAMLREQLKAGMSQPIITKLSIGKTGNIMFWESQHLMPWGQAEVTKIQYLKQ